MKVLVTGGTGQVGRALLATAPDGCELLLPGRSVLDLSRPQDVGDYIRDIRPDLIVNSGAYTAVDRAEEERELAGLINRDVVAAIAVSASEVDARLIHISTDFVFDGSATRPHTPNMPTRPLNVYGRTKREGEIAAGTDAIIVRTAWIYAAKGKNFVHAMLRIMESKTEIRVVADQISTPTCAEDLAKALWKLDQRGQAGIYHFTNAGVASWYDFALAIGEEAYSCGLLKQMPTVIPIPSEEYPTPAQRPQFSVLDCMETYKTIGYVPPHWRVSLRNMLKEINTYG